MNTVLTSFVNNHHPTLESLGLCFPAHGSLDLSCLLDMSHLPHLRKFSLDYVFTTLDTSALRHFLKTHSSGLHEFQIGVFDSKILPWSHSQQQDLLGITLPRLEAITFRGEKCLWNLDGTLAVL